MTPMRDQPLHIKQPKANKRAVSAEQPQARQRTVPHRTSNPCSRADTPQQPIADERLPHKIGFTPGMTADMWAGAYIKVIEKAAGQQEIYGMGWAERCHAAASQRQVS